MYDIIPYVILFCKEYLENFNFFFLKVLWHIGKTMGYGLDGMGSIPGSARFFSSQCRPDRIWDLTTPLPD
jgi:hypothetical protein